MVMLLFVCLFLHKLAPNKPGMNWAPTKNSIIRKKLKTNNYNNFSWIYANEPHLYKNKPTQWEKKVLEKINGVFCDSFFCVTRDTTD